MAIVHLSGYSGNGYGARAACRQEGWFRRPCQIAPGANPAHLVSGVPDDVTCPACKETPKWKRNLRAWTLLMRAAKQSVRIVPAAPRGEGKGGDDGTP